MNDTSLVNVKLGTIKPMGARALLLPVGMVAEMTVCRLVSQGVGMRLSGRFCYIIKTGTGLVMEEENGTILVEQRQIMGMVEIAANPQPQQNHN